MSKNLGFVSALAVIIAWLVLFFSGHGLLIGSTTPDGGVGMLKCRYFTGASVVDRAFLYTRGGALGRDSCPRSVKVTK